MSKLEDGKLSIVRRSFNVRNMVEAVVSQIGHSAADKGLMVTTDMTACEAELLVGDDCRIQQIVANFAWRVPHCSSFERDHIAFSYLYLACRLRRLLEQQRPSFTYPKTCTPAVHTKCARVVYLSCTLAGTRANSPKAGI